MSEGEERERVRRGQAVITLSQHHDMEATNIMLLPDWSTHSHMTNHQVVLYTCIVLIHDLTAMNDSSWLMS